jgi:hypothetical protein
MSNPVNAEITLSHLFPWIETGSAKRANHGTSVAANAKVLIHNHNAPVRIPGYSSFGADVHTWSIGAMETGKGDEENVRRRVLSLLQPDHLPERTAVSRYVVLIHACNHTSHATAAP